MTDLKLYGSFISVKVSKIRFIQEKYKSSDSFLTGSWGLSTNAINLWKLTKDEFSDEDADSDYVPKSIAKIPVEGDVTGLEFLDENTFVCSTADKNAQLLIVQLNREVSQHNLTELYHLNNIHKYGPSNPAACTGISVHNTDIATVGEDGSLNILSNQAQLKKSFSKVDSCSITCVSFINPNEILTGNRIGIINIFDVRNNQNKPSNSMTISSEDDKKSNGVTCINYHPNQKHIVLCGSEEGSITVWDLRQPSFPASYLTAHESSITDLAYHRSDPSKLFTASQRGELYQWSYSANQISDRIDGNLRAGEGDNVNPWLCRERTKNRINWLPLLKGMRKSINAFDSSGSKLVCGCDNEAVYLIDNI